MLSLAALMSSQQLWLPTQEKASPKCQHSWSRGFLSPTLAEELGSGKLLGRDSHSLLTVGTGRRQQMA